MQKGHLQIYIYYSDGWCQISCLGVGWLDFLTWILASGFQLWAKKAWKCVCSEFSSAMIGSIRYKVQNIAEVEAPLCLVTDEHSDLTAHAAIGIVL